MGQATNSSVRRFFTQPKAPLDAILAYFHYTKRASGGVHDHAWNYYLQILTWWRAGRGPVWTEGAIVGLAWNNV